MTSKLGKRKDLCLSDKIQVINELESNTSQTLIAAKFKVSQSQVSRIWKAREKLLESHRKNINPSRKRARESIHKDVDEELLHWFTQAKGQGLLITGPMLRQKAKDLSQKMGLSFEPSLSWVQRWRDRQGIVFKRQHGVKQDHDNDQIESTTGAVNVRMDVSNIVDNQMREDAGLLNTNNIGMENSEETSTAHLLVSNQAENSGIVEENESLLASNQPENSGVVEENESSLNVVEDNVEVESKPTDPKRAKLNESDVVDDADESSAYFVIPDDISKSPEEGPTQPRLDAYPKTLMGGSGTPRLRSFCSNWFGRFPWLEYSVSFDKVYCFACRHYGSTIFKVDPTDAPGKKFMRKKGATIYATTGFCRWAKAHERMQRHNSSARHLEAMGPWLEDTLNREKRGESSNGTDLPPLSQSEGQESRPTLEITSNRLPSKRKRSRPTKKSIKYGDNDLDTSLGCPAWCTCTKCIEMSKMHECVCCCDVPEIRAKVEAFDSTLLCIIEHPGFAAVCLNEWSIQAAYYHHKQESGPPSVSEEYERFRYIAYCQFVRWCWGYLREDMHIPLPSCVVTNIKARFHAKANLPALDDLPASPGVLRD